MSFRFMYPLPNRIVDPTHKTTTSNLTHGDVPALVEAFFER